MSCPVFVRGDRAHTRLRHQQPCLWMLVGNSFHRHVELVDLFVWARHQPQQILSPVRCPSRRAFCPASVHSLLFFCKPRFSAKCCNPFFTRVWSRHQLVSMNQQLPQIPLFPTWHPQPRKTAFHQQLQNVRRIPPVRLLLANVAGPDLRRVSNPDFAPQPLQ